MGMATLWQLPRSGLLPHLHCRFKDREAETFHWQCEKFSFIFAGFSSSLLEECIYCFGVMRRVLHIKGQWRAPSRFCKHHVGEMLSSAHTAEKNKNQQCPITIAENIWFLARQGIALRRDGNKSDSNFIQVLHLRTVDQPQLLPWLEYKIDKYTSLQVQNEILTVIHTVFWIISKTIQVARYFSIMADEVTDSLNKEQVVICFRRVDEQFEAHEDFVGLMSSLPSSNKKLPQELPDSRPCAQHGGQFVLLSWKVSLTITWCFKLLGKRWRKLSMIQKYELV